MACYELQERTASSFFKMTDMMKIGQRLGKNHGGQGEGSKWGWRERHSRDLWSLGLL